VQKRQRLLIDTTHTAITAAASSLEILDYAPQIIQILTIGQSICGQTQGVIDLFCKEVEHTTEGRARLSLHSMQFPVKTELSSPSILISFPVCFSQRNYGILYVTSDPEQPMSPALPLSIAQLLAQICSWVLYTFEQSAIVQIRSSQLNHQTYIHLTKREREVLLLMGRGNDRKSISSALSISSATVGKHQQHIYEQLGVHCERDAIIAAYCAHLFSPIEELQHH
jgi:DNA-binding CsgD family transcriptional regulator